MQVIGIVAQHPVSVRRYIEETGLAFDILIDLQRDTLREYGVWHRVGIDAWNIARPAVFLIDRDATIQYSFIADRQSEFPLQNELFSTIDSSRL